MAKDKVNEIIQNGFLELPTGRELYQEFVRESQIEKSKEEDYVIRSLMKGMTKKGIVKELVLKHPQEKFSVDDINRFLDRNKDIVELLEKEKSQLARRHLDAKVKIEEEIAEVAMFTKKLISKYDEQKDNASTLQAINTLMKLLVNYSKIAGFYDAHSDQPTNQNIIQIISEKNSTIASKMVEADFKMHKMIENEKDNPEEKPEIQETNS